MLCRGGGQGRSWTQRRTSFSTATSRPVQDEVTLTDLTVTGSIPEHLDGRYVRIGPNPIGQPDPATHHWFIGEGMVHGVRLRERAGRVVPQPLGAVVRASPRRSASRCRRARAPRSSPTSRRTRTSSPTPVARWRSPKPASARTSSPTSSTRSGRATSTARCPSAGRRTRTPTRPPASSTRCRTGSGGATSSTTPCSAPTAGSGARSPIEVHGAPMIHDFSLTANHVVVYDLPVRFDLDMVTEESGGCRTAGTPDYPAARRRDAPGQRRLRRALVRRRAVLRVPPDERLRGRRADRPRRRPPPEDVRHGPQRSERGPAHARPVDDRPRGRQGASRPASTTTARSSRASTSDSRVTGIATGTPSAAIPATVRWGWP